MSGEQQVRGCTIGTHGTESQMGFSIAVGCTLMKGAQGEEKGMLERKQGIRPLHIHCEGPAHCICLLRVALQWVCRVFFETNS